MPDKGHPSKGTKLTKRPQKQHPRLTPTRPCLSFWPGYSQSKSRPSKPHVRQKSMAEARNFLVRFAETGWVKPILGLIRNPLPICVGQFENHPKLAQVGASKVGLAMRGRPFWKQPMAWFSSGSFYEALAKQQDGHHLSETPLQDLFILIDCLCPVSVGCPRCSPYQRRRIPSSRYPGASS